MQGDEKPATKLCGKCGATKALSEFHRRGPSGRQAWCRSCNAAHGRARHAANPSVFRAYNDRCKAKSRALSDQLKSRPCTDCGRSFPPYVMDLDHLPGTDKTASPSRYGRSASPHKFLAEAAKCEVVCANCHRVRTHERRMAAKAVAPCAQRQSVIP